MSALEDHFKPKTKEEWLFLLSEMKALEEKLRDFRSNTLNRKEGDCPDSRQSTCATSDTPPPSEQMVGAGSENSISVDELVANLEAEGYADAIADGRKEVRKWMHSYITDAELDDLERLANAAQPGDWRISHSGYTVVTKADAAFINKANPYFILRFISSLRASRAEADARVMAERERAAHFIDTQSNAAKMAAENYRLRGCEKDREQMYRMIEQRLCNVAKAIREGS